MPRKGRNWTAADQLRWEEVLAAGDAARMRTKREESNRKRSLRLAKEFEVAFEERVRLAREAFALRHQMEDEQRQSERAAELAAELAAEDAEIAAIIASLEFPKRLAA